MGWILMGERELQRVEALSSGAAGRLSVTDAVAVLAVSRRQAHPLTIGNAQQRQHGACGRPSNRALTDGLREVDLAHVSERYANFGPTLAAEMLFERHWRRSSRPLPRNSRSIRLPRRDKRHAILS